MMLQICEAVAIFHSGRMQFHRLLVDVMQAWPQHRRLPLCRSLRPVNATHVRHSSYRY